MAELEREAAKAEHNPRHIRTERTIVLDKLDAMLEAAQVLMDNAGLGDRVGVDALYRSTGDIARCYELAATLP